MDSNQRRPVTPQPPQGSGGSSGSGFSAILAVFLSFIAIFAMLYPNGPLMLLDEYQSVNESPKAVQESTLVTAKWSPPPQGWYKVNVDGVVFTKRKQTGIGVIIRDDTEAVVATMSKKMVVPLGALETEAKAMETGVRFAANLGIRDAIFEGDSLAVYNVVHGSGSASTAIQNIVTGILRQAQGFRKFTFSHVKRQGNVPAHVLAQYAGKVEDYVTWLEECPSHIDSVCPGCTWFLIF